MRKRSKARVLALKFLYRIDLTKEDVADALEGFWQEHRAGKQIKEFSVQIAQGTRRRSSVNG